MHSRGKHKYNIHALAIACLHTTAQAGFKQNAKISPNPFDFKFPFIEIIWFWSWMMVKPSLHADRFVLSNPKINKLQPNEAYLCFILNRLKHDCVSNILSHRENIYSGIEWTPYTIDRALNEIRFLDCFGSFTAAFKYNSDYSCMQKVVRRISK